MSSRIGTLAEGHLHASLKDRCAEPGARYEALVEGLIVDVVNPGGLVEVQTSGFSRLKPKLERLLPAHGLRLVLPIPGEKIIVRMEEDECGRRELSRRRSPKRGQWWEAFRELVSIAPWLLHPNLCVELLLTREEEIRAHQPGKAWRRQGWVVRERRLVEVLEVRAFHGRGDWAALLPFAAGEPFTSADLAAAWGSPRWVGQKACYTLHRAGLLERLGKQGRCWEHVLISP
ncbi:MAG: hypothetical protein Q8O14_10360 [bacterium]|nr:hypothetical protein [bacterium]